MQMPAEYLLIVRHKLRVKNKRVSKTKHCPPMLYLIYKGLNELFITVVVTDIFCISLKWLTLLSRVSVGYGHLCEQWIKH